MAGFNSSSDEEVISGINITPLVDVVLVLLIIFMITAPVLYKSSIEVKLPAAVSGKENEKPSLNFTLNKEGVLRLEEKPLDKLELAARLAAITENEREQGATISADRATPHGTVVELMDQLRQAGLTRIAINVESASRNPRGKL